jgi:hypothetical protein
MASLASDAVTIAQASVLFGAAYPTANLGLFAPIIVEQPLPVTQISHENGRPVSGNVDVGIYDEFGTRLVSIGGVAQAGANSLQVHNVTDTVLAPGVYYKALVLDNVTGQLQRTSTTALMMRMCGMKEMASAYPLPATATLAGLTTAYLPAISVHTLGGTI